MSFLVTARKWRPQKFEELVGQEHISTTIKNAIINERIAHAYIFAGPRGVGKTTTARIFAKILNCLNPTNGEPCNKCEMCNSFNNSQSLDVIEIDGASNRRIEEIRTLRESVKYAPTKGNYKVYIIDEVHMLTTESFNALLKTLEEPPDRTIFIFATTDVHKVPPTIISRCQRFDFRRIEIGTLKHTIKKIADAENIKIDDQSLTIIAKKADGALRDAESLFDQLVSFCGNDINAKEVATMLNIIDEDIYFELTDAINSKNFGSAFNITSTIYENGWNFIDFLNGLIEHFRNLMTVIVRKDSKLIESSEDHQKKFLNYLDCFSEGDILRILGYLNKVQYEIRSSQNPKLKIEVSLCHLIGLQKTSQISELIEGLNKAELPEKKKEQSNNLIQHSSHNLNIQYGDPEKSKEDIEATVHEPSVNLDTLTSNWMNFIELINTQKFALGASLQNSKPLESNDNTIIVELNSKEDVDIIENNRSYLSCLMENSEQIFNQKLNFSFISKFSSPQFVSDNKSSVISNVDPNLSQDENSLINAILNELGGREINR
ncbi:MAG: DNA polymerase III subunit gamma/tau [Ignavibacteriae bacterium HGW-Ignavibacteriae-2]|nr:MAG: DNA polymerase III subunit gamma/tau [Ignavibacteriae bacterium HGW-Ignavibacteriae-2]